MANFFDHSQKSGTVVGNDADQVILDTKNPRTVKKEDLFTKLRWSAHEGMHRIGRPIVTVLRGEVVYNHGKIIGEHQGQWQKSKNHSENILQRINKHPLIIFSFSVIGKLTLLVYSNSHS